MSGAEFPKSRRLRRAGEFGSVLKRGKSWRCGCIKLYAIRQEKESSSRVGLLVSKRFAKQATERNRLKRIVREFFRTMTGKGAKGYDCVVRAVEEFNRLTNNEIRHSIKEVFGFLETSGR